MLNGRYDDETPERTSVDPLFQLLQAPKKRLRFEGGHMPPVEIAVPILTAWLDETLGRSRGSNPVSARKSLPKVAGRARWP